MAAKSAAKGKNLVAPGTKETRNGFPDMLILHDPRSAEYGSALRPEQPARVLNAVPYLRRRHPAWVWRVPSAPVPDEILLLAHTAEHLRRLEEPRDFDSDTPYFPEIGAHARRAVGAALEAARHALAKGTPVFSLMRPPGHHATAGEAMGFCYLNQIAVAALAARRQPGVERVAVWDFDAHHGNGTAAILRPDPAFRYSSVHQHPGYPGTGAGHAGNSRNWPVAPGGSRARAPGRAAALLGRRARLSPRPDPGFGGLRRLRPRPDHRALAWRRRIFRRWAAGSTTAAIRRPPCSRGATATNCRSSSTPSSAAWAAE